MKKGNLKMTLIGVSILLLTCLLIALAFFVPRWRQSLQMKDRLALLLSDDPTVFAVMEPLRMQDQEQLLSAQAREEVQRLLESVTREGLRVSGREELLAGAWDISITVRLSDGQSACVYFAEEGPYYMQAGKAFRFRARNAAQYAALYAHLQSLFTD